MSTRAYLLACLSLVATRPVRGDDPVEVDYGIDLDAIAGGLGYAEDTERAAVGGRVSWWFPGSRRPDEIAPLAARSQPSRGGLVAEYLQTLDGRGGILRFGSEGSLRGCAGFACGELGGRVSLAIPWGRDLDKDGSILGHYTFSFDPSLGIFLGANVPIGTRSALALRVSADGGGNVLKGISNLLRCADGRCAPEKVDGIEEDGHPNWPSFHWTVTGSVGVELEF